MQCLYCGKPLGLLRELADGEFCSGEHRQRYRTITKRAFGRLMQSRPEPASFVKPVQVPPGLLARQPVTPPRAGLLRLRSVPPRPAGKPARRDARPAGPFFQFYNTLMAPIMPVAQAAAALAPASAIRLPEPEAARAPAAVLAHGESLDFRAEPATLSPVCLDLQPIDLPLELLRGARSHRPATAPLLLLPRIQEAAAALVPTNGITHSHPACKPSLAAARPAPELCGSLPRAPHAVAKAAACLPEMPLAGFAGPVDWAPHPVLPRLELASLNASFAAASVLSTEARLADSASQPLEAAAVMPSRRRVAGPAPLEASGPPLMRLLALTPQPADCSFRTVLVPEQLPFAASGLRRPALTTVADRLALKSGVAAREEVTGADMAVGPAVIAARPSIGAGSVLPALASLFRYGRASSEVPAQPAVSEGLTPHNRLAFPVAYRELPMPVQHPRVPRSSELRIVETFEYLKPMEEPPVDLLQNLVRLWRTSPAYLRFAAAAACLILLMWTVIPGRTVTSAIASRWGLIEERIERRAAIELTEDFRDDMSQWSGSGDWVQSWRISRTGYARPGRLALYEPSMRMQDYRVEFLMQIEQQAVGFAYRATDRENFYAAKIKVAKPGPLPVLSLVRYPVIQGREGPKVEIPIRVMLHNNTPYRVQLTVKGRGYSTSIEGHLVDFWTDDRLQTGGFGFFSDTGESARVYWMRLSHQNDFVGRVCAYIRQPALPRRRTEVLQ